MASAVAILRRSSFILHPSSLSEPAMLNLFSDEVRRNPFPLYAHFRAACPVMLEPTSGVWMLFDYATVKRAFDDTETFVSDTASVGAHPAPPWLVFIDPPRHTKLRAIISKAFTPRMVEAMEPRIRELSRELLDRAIASCGAGVSPAGESCGAGVSPAGSSAEKAAGTATPQTIDLAADFSVPLPMRVIAEMIGIPQADWPRYVRWSSAILNISYSVRGMSPGKEAANAANEEFSAVVGEMADYLSMLVAERRAQPRDDLLTRLVAAEVDGERLSPHDLLAFFQLLIVGGQETTTNLINNAVLCLLEHPEQLALLRRSPELLPSAIEEVLRYRSPFQLLFRGTRREVELGGQTIPAGKLVFLMIGSANRDSKQIRDADHFDITRNPNPHLAFGHGIHFCLGAPLSRLEARIALSDILERLPDLKLANNEPWPPRPALHVYGPARLPLRFGEPRVAAG
jgi:cytochrome P450